MTLKSDAKFEKKNNLLFQNDKNLVNFDPSTQKFQKFALSLDSLCKVYNVWPKKVQRGYRSWHWRVNKNLTENCVMFWKIKKIWTLMGFFRPK